VLFLAVSVLLTATLAPVTARALELVMYDKAGCVWCNRFERDIGRRYSSIDVSRDAPLRRVDIHDQRRSGVDLEEPVLYTPTFVLADDNGAEIGRITGYQGEEAFWANLDDLLRARPGRRAY
jgi:thioredoxin-related protein